MTKATAAGERTVTLDIHLLGRDYKVACKESERAELTEAVAYLDQRMREIRGAGKIAGVDRIAVMAALNITNDLLRERKAPPPALAGANATGDIDGAAARRRIQSMHAAIDQVMAGQEKLF
jgi:cell division protein ZapA